MNPTAQSPGTGAGRTPTGVTVRGEVTEELVHAVVARTNLPFGVVSMVLFGAQAVQNAALALPAAQPAAPVT